MTTPESDDYECYCEETALDGEDTCQPCRDHQAAEPTPEQVEAASAPAEGDDAVIALIRDYAARFAHKDTSASSLHTAFAVFAARVLEVRGQQSGVPVASPERVAEVLRRTVLATTYGGQLRLADVDLTPLLDALLAADVFVVRDEATVKAEAAEEIAEAAEEAADELDLPVMAEWLDQRDWFKGQLHALAAKAREIGGLS